MRRLGEPPAREPVSRLGVETPEDWVDKAAKRSQKDVDARWTKKHGGNYHGYMNRINVDRRHKLIRRYHVTDAAVHDSLWWKTFSLRQPSRGRMGGQRLPVGGDQGRAVGEGRD